MSDAHFFRREWRGEAPFHVAVMVLLALGFLMYAVMYGWVNSVGAGSANGAPDLVLPAGASAMVVEPAWLLDATDPDYNLGPPREVPGGGPASAGGSRAAEGGASPATGGGGPIFRALSPGEAWARSQGYDRTLVFLRESMPTEGGTAWVWGLPSQAAQDLTTGMRFVSGGWPAEMAGKAGAAGASGASEPEVAIPRDMADRLGKSVGDSFWIGYARWPFGLWSEASARISGIFQSDSPMLDAVLTDEAWLADFTQLFGENALLAWGTPGRATPGRGMSVIYPGSRQSVPARLPSTREPMVPAWLLKGENVGDPHDPRDLVGIPTPFAMTLAATELTSATPARELAGVGESAHLRSTPLVFLVLVLLVAAVTVMSVVRVLDRQRALGIMKSIGLGVRGLRRHNRVAGALDACAGTVLGALAFVILKEWLMQTAGATFTVTWSMAAGWVAVLAFIVWWQGAVVAILFHHTDTRSLLLRNGRFDWWALLRFDLTKPAE